MLNLKLLVVGGEIESAELTLTLPAVVGRSRESDVHLPHPLVSRRHCELRELNGRLVVRDLGSLNGTFVGSERIEEAILHPGELLTVGTVTFRAVYDLIAKTAGHDRDGRADVRSDQANAKGEGSRATAAETVRHAPSHDTAITHDRKAASRPPSATRPADPAAEMSHPQPPRKSSWDGSAWIGDDAESSSPPRTHASQQDEDVPQADSSGGSPGETLHLRVDSPSDFTTNPPHHPTVESPR